jgi:hypothetical protein
MTHCLVATCERYAARAGDVAGELVAGGVTPVVVPEEWNGYRAWEYTALLWAARCLPERDRVMLVHDTCEVMDVGEVRGAMMRDTGEEIFAPTDMLQFNIGIYSVGFLRRVRGELEKLRGCRKGDAVGFEGKLKWLAGSFGLDKAAMGGKVKHALVPKWVKVSRSAWDLKGWGLRKWFVAVKGSWHPCEL